MSVRKFFQLVVVVTLLLTMLTSLTTLASPNQNKTSEGFGIQSTPTVNNPIPPLPISQEPNAPLDLGGDKPPLTSYLWVGHGGVIVGVHAFDFTNNPAGNITVNGIPYGSTIIRAMLYATSWESNGDATATFQSHNIGETPTLYTDTGGGLTLGTYLWDVSNLVTGDGTYSYSTNNILHSYATMLVVVYQHDNQPIRQVIINEGLESIQFASSTSNWSDVAEGQARLLIMTEADDSLSGGTETIAFNGNQLASGDVFHANLGPYASLLQFDVQAVSGQNSVTITTQNDWFGWHLAILEVNSGSIPEIELTGLEVSQAIQNWNNSVILIEDKRTYVRAHVKSDNQTVHDVTASLYGYRNGVALPGSPLSSSNIGGNVDILENPNRSQLNDSFYFELPASWRSGTVELEFRGTNKTIVCREHASIDNDCKTTVTFERTPALDMRIVGAIWNESNGTSHAPTSADIRELVQEIEATYPIPDLQWDNPYNFELILDDFVQDPLILNIRLAEQRVLDGCMNVFGLGCQRIYLGVIVDPPAGTSLLGLGGFPPNVASGFWIGTNRLKGILPHEVGHALGRLHTPFCGAATLPWWHYPYTDGHISQDDSGDNAFYGFHISTKAVYGPTTGDLMSYCFPVWPSDWTYRALHDEISSRFGSSSEAVGTMNVASSLTLLISGRITPTLDTGSIDSIYKFSTSSTIPVPTSGSYALRLEDASSNVLATYPFEPGSGAQCPPNCSENEQIGAFAMGVPFDPQVSHILLLHGQRVLDSNIASANPPQVSVVYPNGGEVLSGSNATLSWSASDLDGDILKYAVQYSTNGGTTWQTLVSSWISTTYRLDLSAIAGTDQGMLRVLASDGFHTTQDQSNGTFSVARHSPQASIQTPENNSLYVGSQTIILEGDAFDNEDGQLSGAALTWSSDLNGILGNGHSLAVNASTLAEGAHIITLTAQDSDGQINSITIAIQIYRTRPVLITNLLVQPTGLNFIASEGGGQTAWQTLSMRNGGDGTMSWSASTDQEWIRVSSLSGIAPTDILIAADPTGLPLGQYTGNITIAASSATNSPQTIPVMLYVLQVEKVYLPVVMR